jgi:phosphotransferase system HPr (HPr) family protein
MTVSTEILIQNDDGLHARPTASFVKRANMYKSKITVAKNRGDTANGKSIINVLCLAVEKGDLLSITADGEDAQQAICGLQSLANNQFNESS